MCCVSVCGNERRKKKADQGYMQKNAGSGGVTRMLYKETQESWTSADHFCLMAILRQELPYLAFNIISPEKVSEGFIYHMQ